MYKFLSILSGLFTLAVEIAKNKAKKIDLMKPMWIQKGINKAAQLKRKLVKKTRRWTKRDKRKEKRDERRNRTPI